MKNLLLPILALLSSVTGFAQTIGEAFYVYRSDGMINTFFRNEVDSMAYSYYDIDSTLYDEVVTQVIYTPDSIYRFHLAEIDSIGFVTPDTKYQPGVVRLEGTIRDYIIGSDSLSVFFRPDTPSGILPKIGDKLVTTEVSETFIGGFLGQVEEREQRQDTIAVHCCAIGIEEVFECFYYTTDGELQSESSRANAIGWNWDSYYAPGPFVFSSTTFLNASLKPIICPFKVRSSFNFSVAPMWKSKGSIIVHPLLGVVVSADIRQDISFAEDWAFSGELDKTHDFPPFFQGSYPIMPFVTLYGNLGVFVKANAKLAFEEHCKQDLGCNIHYEASYRPLLPAPFQASIPKINISKVSFTTEHEEKLMLDGYLAAGLYGEVGIAPLLSRHILSAGFRFEGGAKLGGDVMIYDSDSEDALVSTSTYKRIRAGELYLKPFCKVGMQAKLLFVGEGEVDLYEHEWDLGKFKLVPDFSNTTLTRDEDTPSTLWAATTASGPTIVPSTLGFKLFENGEEEGLVGTESHSYWSLSGYPSPFYEAFDNQSPAKIYMVYPTVNLFGIEMLAEPKAEINTILKPITLDVAEISDATAKVYGKIENYELLENTMKYGLGYKESGSNGTIMYDATSIDADGTFSVKFVALKPNTSYKFFAYLIIDGQTYYGLEKIFWTKDEDRKLYGVITYPSVGFEQLTYYYDGKQNERQGEKVGFPHNRYSAVRRVSFDSSFANYNPTSTAEWFINMHCLESIQHIEYINTSNVTDMSYMFYGCKALKRLDLSSFNTSNVTDMTSMFYGCEALTSLNVNNFNTSNVTDMTSMFDDCRSLSKLNLSSFNTANVTSMGYMFYSSGLKSLDLSNFKTNKVRNMICMFRYCNNLKQLDLSNFTTTYVQTADCMFEGCTSLVTIYAKNWKKSLGYMFGGCDSLSGGKGTKLYDNIYGYDEYGNSLHYYCESDGRAAHIDGGKDNPGLFTAK